MRKLLSALAATMLLLVSSTSPAVLGESESAAKKKEKRFIQRYQAADPYYRTDAKGRIVQECWQAPEEGWGLDKALQFARELIPAKLRKGKPKQERVEGNLLFFRYPNGATVVLSEGPSGIIQLEVFAPGYKGRRC